MFIVKKKDGGNWPTTNLKELKQNILFLHFKMESLQSLQTLLQKKQVHVWKLDLKDAYLLVPLSQVERKRVMFKWEETRYQFLCLCFGLAPAPYVSKKLIKIPMALLRRMERRIVIWMTCWLLAEQGKRL